MTKFVVELYESEAGWGGRVYGYVGPFDDYETANQWQTAYNQKWNNKPFVPSWYIVAQTPEKFDPRAKYHDLKAPYTIA